jgi:hypothetical protein
MKSHRRTLLWCLAAVAVAGVAIALALAPGSPSAATGAAGADATIKLIIDYNDGCQKVFPALTWKDGMTSLSALEAAKAKPHGIQFEYTGKDDTAFLTQIDDLKNEGGGKDKKNWLYWVNDKMADQGFGVCKLDKGDVVLFKFDVYRDK